MGQVLRLTRWEWFKLRRRWMPWILLAVLVAIPQVWLWAEFFAYGNVNYYEEPSLYFRDGENDSLSFSCAEFDDGTVADRLSTLPEEHRREGMDALAPIREFDICGNQLEGQVKQREWHSQVFVAPVSLANGLASSHLFGLFLVIFLASSLLGSEYGQGTLRLALARGVSRWQMLASKALLLTLLMGAALLIVCVPLFISSLIATAQVPEGKELADPGGWSTPLLMFGKVVVGLVPYIVLALLLTVLTSSTVLGTSFSFVYLIAEGTIISTMGPSFDRYDWFQNFLDFNLGPAVAGWLADEGVRATGQDSSFFPLDQVQSNLKAFLVMLAYMCAMGGAAFRLFLRRDVSGAKGS